MSYSYLFFNDYSEGAHPSILEALSRDNFKQEHGYGLDSFSKEAEHMIQKRINQPEAAVHFVASGTQANLIGISSILRPYESVIAADNGHIEVHETGAIEATGHKVTIAPGVAGKLTPEAIQEVVERHTDEHMVRPRIVYISQSTELGTIYCKRELQAIKEVCKKNGLYLYIDGARMGQALMSQEADADLHHIANSCDLFTIGGTKNGALLGEALVIINPKLKENFRYHLKQRGALLAKGRTIALQFIAFFKEDLYFNNAKHANDMALKIAQGVEARGYRLLYPASTNQIFPILPNSLIEKLQKKYGFYVWAKMPTDPEKSMIRLVTSWATEEAAVSSFLGDI